MIEKQNNIWNKIEVNLPTNSKKKNFNKKNVIIKQIGKEKTITQGQNNLNKIEPIHTPKKLFINKKRGRRLKESNDEIVAGAHDKFSDDNLKRKIKTHYHNYIIALLNSKIVFKAGYDKLLKFGKIKSSVTQNITVEFNQDLFNKKIKDVIIYVSDKYQNQEMNLECLDYIMKHQKENTDVLFFLNMTYKDLYLNYYLKSTKKDFKEVSVDESYEAHLKKLRNFGENYIKNYQKNALNLIEFYKTCKKRKPRQKKDEKKIKDSHFLEISSSNKKKFTYLENEDIYDKNSNDENNINLGNNKTSFGTQTDRILTDDESESDEF